MDAVRVMKLEKLMAATAGRPEIAVGLVDGPVETAHADLREARITVLTASAGCRADDSLACRHGTFVAGILAAKRGSNAPALCPGCTLLVRPVFCEVSTAGRSCPDATPRELAEAVVQTVDAGARVVNLSMGLAGGGPIDLRDLKEAFDYADARGVVVVVASGNQGRVGPVPLLVHPRPIPVAACSNDGRLLPESNIGPSVGKQGLAATGHDIVGPLSTGGSTAMTGTSVAAPFVTGTIALLWSLFPRASPDAIRRAVLLPGLPRRSVMPPMLDAERGWAYLKTSVGH